MNFRRFVWVITHSQQFNWKMLFWAQILPEVSIERGFGCSKGAHSVITFRKRVSQKAVYLHVSIVARVLYCIYTVYSMYSIGPPSKEMPCRAKVVLTFGRARRKVE